VVTIIKAFRSFTISPVFLILLSHPGREDGVLPCAHVTLKLYGRRCLANDLIKQDDGKLWSLEKEREYQRYIAFACSRFISLERFNDSSYLFFNDVDLDGEFCAANSSKYKSELAAY
jgi:hypothetical protein